MFWSSRWKKALDAEKAEHDQTRELYVKSIQERIALKEGLAIATATLLGNLPVGVDDLSQDEIGELARVIRRNPVLLKFHGGLFRRIRELEKKHD